MITEIVRIRSIIVIGRPKSAAKNLSSEEAKEIALLKFESIIPPKTIAKIMGAIGYSLILIMYPNAPKNNIRYTSNIRLLQPKAPTTQRTIIKGNKILLGTVIILLILGPMNNPRIKRKIPPIKPPANME